ncbi:M16 family metallopeptidase [Hufsiella arboris]|nr:pitrilysin family protein [Hufsiella arboris]
MDHQIFTLGNGIRILFNPFPSNISHACVVINAGSRDEKNTETGLAHFIEHLLFKRTEKRNTNQILNRLELVGADLNAYTTKEYTCIHASFLNPFLDRTLDLFEDILFHSTFPEEEMEKEKSVILDEIASYQDQPEDAINDDFEELIFKDHPLGKNILGTPESVQSLNQSNIFEFLKNNYNTHEIIIAISGNYPVKKIKTVSEKFFGKLAENNSVKDREKLTSFIPAETTLAKPISQTHCVIGTQAYSLYDPNRVALLLLNNLLGGPGMSSRLNLEIREKHGIAYTIDSNYIPLSDTGIFSIYFGTDQEKTAKALKLIHRELRKLRENKLGSLQLHQAKQRFMGQIALAEENRMGLIMSMAKSLFDYGKVDTLEEVFQKINGVTTDQLGDAANDIFNPMRLSVLTFEPEN